MPRIRAIIFTVILSLFLTHNHVISAPPVEEAPARAVAAVRMDGVINPVTAEFLEKSIEKASDEKAEALVIMLDTPGGLDVSMRRMVKAIIGSPVPVITYVSPSGARAASAGVFITLASKVAAMAPGTNIGAAHPVEMGGQKMDEHMAAKVENDSAAYIVSLAHKYGRNAEWAEQAVRKSVSISESEAVKKGVVDLTADSLEDLLKKVDGRAVVTGYGEKKLKTAGAKVEFNEMGFRLKLLKVISDPNIAYLLMMAGIIGLFFELSNPGLVLPGVVGAISLILAFYAFQTLPVNYAGVLLILLSIVLFIAEVKVTSYGLLSVGAVISLLLGSVMLIESPAPYMKISLKVILPGVITLSAFFLVLLRVALQSHRARQTTGPGALVGAVGEAREDLAPEGDVFVEGAHWRGYSDEPVKKGEKVVVIAVDGLRLKVGPKK